MTRLVRFVQGTMLGAALRQAAGHLDRKTRERWRLALNQHAIRDAFCAGDAGAVSRLLKKRVGPTRVRVAFDDALPMHVLSCLWSQTPGQGPLFTFRHLSPGPLVEIAVDRWLSLLTLILHVERSGSLEGRTLLNFNDTAMDPGLAFCGTSPAHILMADASFIASRGYAERRALFCERSTPWHDRADQVFWRGSSLGQAGRPILEMQRARLCMIARDAGLAWLDAGFSEFLDISESDAACLRSEGLLRDYVPWQQLDRYRFHIDIDGHAASYAGLFSKLLSGALVLKVQSPRGDRQWYQDRLKPWNNFVPISADLGDLVEIAQYCRDRPELARAIARRGQQLAMEATYEREFALALRQVAVAFRIGLPARFA